MRYPKSGQALTASVIWHAGLCRLMAGGPIRGRSAAAPRVAIEEYWGVFRGEHKTPGWKFDLFR
jgi:hypothetical protein